MFLKYQTQGEKNEYIRDSTASKGRLWHDNLQASVSQFRDAPENLRVGHESWGSPAYATTSAAIWDFTKALALELGRYNINVNCMAPDFVDTLMTRELAKRKGLYLIDRITGPQD